MPTSQAKMAAQLGMTFGRARVILQRQIFLSLAQATGRDMCYRCGKRIEKWQDLSVDHKQPWLDVSAELFWDLNNIAFSHLYPCNARATRQPNKFKHLAPVGMNWCSDCKDFKPVAEFNSNVSEYTGLARQCKEHRKARRRDGRG